MISPAPIQHHITELQTKSQGALTKPWISWIGSTFNILFNVQLYGIEEVLVPIAGFSYQIPSDIGILLMVPAGVLATGALQLPATPFNRQRIEVTSSQAVTALTVTAPGTTLLNAPTSLAAGLGFCYQYRSTTTSWHRLY